MIRNILYSICLHLFFLTAIYLGVKNIEYSIENNSIEGISVGLREEEEKKPEQKEVKEEKIEAKKTPPDEKTKEPKKKPKEMANKDKPKTLKKAIIKDIQPPLIKEKKVEEEKIEPKEPKESEEPSLTIRKIYQNDVYTDDVDSLDLSSIYRRSIKTHLNFCFSSVLEGQDEGLEMVEEMEVSFTVSKNGVINFDLKKNVDEKLLKDEKFANYRKVIEKIEKSTKKCAIFRNLPIEKYEIWKEFKVLLTSKNQ